MPTAETKPDILLLNSEIERCNKRLVESISIVERLDLMDYQRLLHSQLLSCG